MYFSLSYIINPLHIQKLTKEIHLFKILKQPTKLVLGSKTFSTVFMLSAGL